MMYALPGTPVPPDKVVEAASTSMAITDVGNSYPEACFFSTGQLCNVMIFQPISWRQIPSSSARKTQIFQCAAKKLVGRHLAYAGGQLCFSGLQRQLYFVYKSTRIILSLPCKMPFD